MARPQIHSHSLEAARAFQIDERLFSRLDAVPVPVWILDLDGRVRYGNRAWMKAAGSVGRPGSDVKWTDACHPDDRPAATAAFEKAAANGAAFEIDVRLRASSRGMWRWWSFAGGPYYGPNGNLESYVGTCSDVTAKQQAQRAVQKLAGRLIAAQETERRRIGRELHDDVMQRVALLTAKLTSMTRSTESSARRIRGDLADAWRQVSAIATTVQFLSHQLHPAKLDLVGLVTTLGSLCRDVSRHHNVHVAFEADRTPSNVPPQTALSLFRIAQEALQNAVKHSDAREIRVLVAGDSARVALQVIDNGKGFDPLAPRAGCLGLLTMRERAELIGGALRIESRPNSGTIVEVIVPLAAKTAPE